jgi:hypothetical protein
VAVIRLHGLVAANPAQNFQRAVPPAAVHFDLTADGKQGRTTLTFHIEQKRTGKPGLLELRAAL